jgi:hypothetical protein
MFSWLTETSVPLVTEYANAEGEREAVRTATGADTSVDPPAESSAEAKGEGDVDGEVDVGEVDSKAVDGPEASRAEPTLSGETAPVSKFGTQASTAKAVWLLRNGEKHDAGTKARSRLLFYPTT